MRTILSALALLVITGCSYPGDFAGLKDQRIAIYLTKDAGKVCAQKWKLGPLTVARAAWDIAFDEGPNRVVRATPALAVTYVREALLEYPAVTLIVGDPPPFYTGEVWVNDISLVHHELGHIADGHWH